LKELEPANRVERLIETADALIIGMDLQGKITVFNRWCEEVTGYSRKEVLGKSVFTFFIPEEDRKAVKKRFKQLTEGKAPGDPPIARWKIKSGEIRTARWCNALIHDEEGNLIEIFGIGIDITEQQIALEKLQASEALFRLLAENAQETIYLYSFVPELKFDYVSPAVKDMTGYSPEEYYADPELVWTLVHPDDREYLFKMREDPASYAGPDEIRWIRKDGSIMWTEHKSTPIFNDEGVLVAIQGVVRDISTRKATAEEMQRARNLAEFLVDLMAHDLNNINQGIMSALEIMQHDPSFPETLIERLQGALNQVERSANLIDSVKRFQRIDFEPIKLQQIDIHDPLEAAIKTTKQAFPTKTLHITTNIKQKQYFVHADNFLIDLFFNLLHNAAKFDRSDRVTIDVRAARSPDKRFLKIKFLDHGPGIPDNDKERIFSRLTTRTSGVKGSGIGLTLVTRILQRYGGSVEVTDRVEGDHSKGTNFTVTIPLKLK
jgi:PAS domain S-box-containing protein